MKIKALVSKKVATLVLAGTIGLGAVGTATYAAAPGLIDKIMKSYVSWTDSDLSSYRNEVAQTIPRKVTDAYASARDSFRKYYDGKLAESKQKIDNDVNAYVKEQGTVTAEERAATEAKISEGLNKKTAEITADLKAQVDAEFKK